MLIKMYKFTISGYVPVYVIVFTVSQFHADVHSVYLVFDFVWHKNSTRKHEYE